MVTHRHSRHLAFTERYQIIFLSRWSKSIPQIAREPGWHKSTVSRELRRNQDYLPGYYRDENAQI